jgi:hypothetical protein
MPVTIDRQPELLRQALPMLRPYCRPQTVMFLGIWLILMVAGRSRFFIDPGALWHIVVGRDILAHWQLPTADTFTCTFAGKHWIAQQWFGECMLAFLHQLGGLDAGLLATATFLAALYAWLGHRMLRAGMHPLIAALVVASAVWASSYHLHPRPHLINIVLLGWTFARLCDFEAGRIPLRNLFWLVPLYLLWSNVHGGMVGGVLTIAVTSAGWWLARLVGRPSPLSSYRQLFALVGLVVACGLTALLTPYGFEMPRVWFELMGSSVLPQIIQEHFPLVRAGAVAWSVVLFALLYLAALLGVPRSRVRVTWLVPLLWFAMTWTRIRHGPLFVVTAAIGFGEMYPLIRWRDWLVRRGSETCVLRRPDAAGPLKMAVVPLFLVAAALALQAAGVRAPVLGRGWARFEPSATPVDLLPELRAYEAERSPGTPIFNDMIFGGFLIYATPGLKVFVDDRCELFGDDWLVRYADAYYHHPELVEAWAREYGFDRALVIPDSVFDCFLRTAAGWAEVRRTDGAVLYRKTSEVLHDAG